MPHKVHGAALTNSCVQDVRKLVPPLQSDKYKGQAGKVGVLGGCQEYTGAPYFAAISALRVGADLSHVFCAKGAGPVIKSYSPELIVHPYLLETHDLDASSANSAVARDFAAVSAADKVSAWMSRLDVLVIGPGLGRDPLVLAAARAVLTQARAASLPVVLDADGLSLVTSDPTVLEGWGASAILTPNVNEMRRLLTATGHIVREERDGDAEAAAVSAALGGVVIVRKGLSDIICAMGDGTDAVEAVTRRCDVGGSLRRCGGQGDVLAGEYCLLLCVFLHHVLMPVVCAYTRTCACRPSCSSTASFS